MQNRQILSVSDNKIYFKTSTPNYGFETVFNILPKEFDSDEFQLFFKMLCIYELTDYEIKNYTINLYKNEEWVDLDEDFITNIIIFLKDKCIKSEFQRRYGSFTVKQIERYIKFKSKNQGPINPIKEQGYIFLPEEYCGNRKLENLFDEIENLKYFFISEDYIKKDIEKKQLTDEAQITRLKKEWIRFFELFEIGPYFIPITKYKSEEFHPASQFIPGCFEDFNLTKEEIENAPNSRYTTQVLVDFNIPLLSKTLSYIIDKNEESKAKILLLILNELFIDKYFKNVVVRNQSQTAKVYYKWFLGIWGQYPSRRNLNVASWISLLYNCSIIPTNLGLQKPKDIFF